MPIVKRHRRNHLPKPEQAAPAARRSESGNALGKRRGDCGHRYDKGIAYVGFGENEITQSSAKS